MRRFWRFTVIIALMLVSVLAMPAALAQEGDTGQPVEILPTYHKIENIRWEGQWWNNCGPATLTSALSYFGYTENQARAADYLKPNTEDKNVSPWQMAEFVNTQVPEIPVYAMVRYGGNLELLKKLVSKNFPVIIEEGYDPEPQRLGWMGHYLLVKGYDDSVQMFITNDSYIGESVNYSYEHIEEFWQHFNYTYIVLYESGREPELLELLGPDANETDNIKRALQKAALEADANGEDAFAWFNMGSNLTLLGEHQRAAVAYDQAFKMGLPWRMLWYQFGPFESYLAVGRYDDVISYAQRNLNDGGGQYVEETFYYAALARAGKGETGRAIDNLRGALQFNPNFAPAQDKLDELLASAG